MRFAPGTWHLAGLPLAAGLAALAFAPWWGLLLVAIGLFTVWFHRDPERESAGEGFLAPADGRVSVIREEEEGEGEGKGGNRIRVGVFMNVTDVHVNRAPADGTVESVEHVPGAHKPAFSKDSDRNERMIIDLDETEVTLIAGAFARRTHVHVEEGQTVERGERIGHVSFGSRGDVLLPEDVGKEDIAVEIGDSVRAGESVIATEPAE